jgi:CRP-like cAMP-binding protein
MVTVVEYLFSSIRDKPLDASDVTTLEAARSELARLRKVTYRVCDILNKTSLGAGADGGGDSSATESKKKAHRGALVEDDSHKTYKKVTVPKTRDEKALIKEAIGKNLLFKGTNPNDLDEFVDVFVQRRFRRGTTVIQQGDAGETFYVVQQGNLDIFINVGEGDNATETQVGVPYGSGSSFGELALLYGSPRAATIRTAVDEDCVLWEITRTAFKGLSYQIEKKLHDNKLKNLKMVKMGEKHLGDILSASQLESMALATQYMDFNKGDAIVREGERGDSFYMIVTGSVDVYVKSAGPAKVATLTEHKFFGEKALISSDTRNATCMAATEVTCLTLTREDFNLMLGNFEDLLSGKTKETTTSKFKKFERSKSSVAFNIEDLEKLRVLGEGAFGKVNLVRYKADGKLYALKAQSKAFVVENSQQEHLLTEYQIMRELNHVLIVKCYQAFQDSRYVYFLMNLLPGGELMDLLDSKKRFPEAWTKFYGASVVAGFSCIHERKIAYRDLKPENLVLDQDGYCHIIDFGLAKRCDKGKTWTFCGTPDYLAPEIIRGKGHDWGVDYWGLGVFFYELTHGYPPFYANDPTNTARKIIKGVFPMPSSFSKPLADIIKKLLVEQNKRLGRTQGGCDAIMAHPWFSGFDWDALLNRTMAVPSKPKLGDLEKLGKKDVRGNLAEKSDWNPIFD